jgi:hypothetical protein
MVILNCALRRIVSFLFCFACSLSRDTTRTRSQPREPDPQEMELKFVAQERFDKGFLHDANQALVAVHGSKCEAPAPHPTPTIQVQVLLEVGKQTCS